MDSRNSAWPRIAAVGGIAGPAAFVLSWAALGASRSGYSPVWDHISDLAAIGAPTRVGMTTGLVVYGVGMLSYGAAAAVASSRAIGALAAATGVAAIAVAALPLESSVAAGHGVAAGFGYLTLAAIPAVGAVRLARKGRTRWAVASGAVAVVAGVALVVSGTGAAPGLAQRVGLTIADIWVAAHAWTLVRGRLSRDN